MSNLTLKHCGRSLVKSLLVQQNIVHGTFKQANSLTVDGQENQ